jgi:hypothetical protein
MGLHYSPVESFFPIRHSVTVTIPMDYSSIQKSLPPHFLNAGMKQIGLPGINPALKVKRNNKCWHPDTIR